MTPPGLAIRSYTPTDEPAVRRICFATALFGGPIKDLIDDERLVTDALLGYYLRYEPELVHVADDGSGVAGYAAAAADTTRFLAVYTRRVVPRLTLQFALRGHVFRGGSWTMLRAARANGARWSRERSAVVERYPAHCHVNVDGDHRGGGVGRALLAATLAALAARGVPGVHASTESEAGRRFFASGGFEEVAGYASAPVGRLAPRPVWVMARRL